MLKLIITHDGSNQDYAEECLESVKRQSYGRFKVTQCDDSIYRLGKIGNIVSALDPKKDIVRFEGDLDPDEDIIIILDGDDKLYSTDALSTIYKAYENTECLMTYGSYINSDGKPGITKKIQNKVIKNGSYRKSPWIYSHPKTFKYKLWKQIKDEDLRNPETGEYWQCAVDHALMYPMLEMAAGRVTHIPEPIYWYRLDNPNSLHNKDAKEQKRIAELINGMPKYKKVKFE